jgi:hypothetical protein
MMLFYAAENSRVVESLKVLLVGFRVKQCRSIHALATCLRKPCHGLEIGLLVIGTSDELVQIGELHNLTRDLRVVLVLPGRDPKLVAMAHKLAPRFIAYADNGFDQIGAVLDKMVGAPRQKRIGQVLPTAPH